MGTASRTCCCQDEFHSILLSCFLRQTLFANKDTKAKDSAVFKQQRVVEDNKGSLWERHGLLGVDQVCYVQMDLLRFQGHRHCYPRGCQVKQMMPGYI